MKTDKQILLKSKEIGFDMYEQIKDSDVISVHAEQQYKWHFNDDDNRNIIPIIQNGFFECIYQDYKGYLLFDCKIDGELLILYVDCLLYADVPVWSWSAKFNLGITVGLEYDVKVIDYVDPTLEVYKKQNMRRDIIERYIEDNIENVHGPMSFFLRAMAWINFVMENPENKILKRGDVSSNNTTTNNFTPDVSYKRKNINLNGINITTHNEKIARKLTSKKPVRIAGCWSVRGHVRHYKNGKTVYIKPYEKGKDRNKRINKIYKI